MSRDSLGNDKMIKFRKKFKRPKKYAILNFYVIEKLALSKFLLQLIVKCNFQF